MTAESQRRDPGAYGDISYSVHDRVAVITLNRPEKLNAFSTLMGAELADALRRGDADEMVRAVVITGAGRAFCAGADFSGGPGVFGAPDEQGFRSDPLEFHPWDVRKPVIAAVNGPAVGLGMTIALQCDIRYIAADARWGIVQNRRGVLPDLRSHWTLPRTVGHAKALEILLTGRMYTGQEAADMGLATAALPADEVLPAAMATAADIAVNVAPVSAALSKRLLWTTSGGDQGMVNELERRIHLHVMGRPDAAEGVMAFLEKRPPQWSLTLADHWPDWMPDATQDG
ncbi:MAG: enoyl-CoA hydratase-related protein [bacterium]|nr:enoyl-CoA hydratase-related protein [bacterium]MCY4193811.1 enoyl-CoA hydratase-related protein [bacterium]MCY4271102.1 enoyl-CoA hydratase-related protein [bacterium]